MPNKNEYIALLKQLISIESFSKTEDKTAEAIAAFLEAKGITPSRLLNNVYVHNKYYDATKPTVLLNSHHDTVKPNAQYSKNPFEPFEENDKLYGLGSNDAGGALVALLACFIHFYESKDLRFNLIFAATAEEEISGKNGIEILLPKLGNIDLGIVGEPTKMDMAIAEKGLLVIDCIANGIAGHAARNEGENAIYKAMQDIEWFRTFSFPKLSKTLGAVKMTVSMIQAGIQHNMVPDTCHFTVDIRTTDAYTNTEIVEIIKSNVQCTVQPRSLRLHPSYIDEEYLIVQIAKELGKNLYGSPTTSDQALMPFTTFKMGPGDSARSHSADEYIYIHEIETAIEDYIKLLTQYNKQYETLAKRG